VLTDIACIDGDWSEQKRGSIDLLTPIRHRLQTSFRLSRTLSHILGGDIGDQSHEGGQTYKELFLPKPWSSSHCTMMAFTSSGFCMRAQCVAATSPLVRFGKNCSMFLDISGFSTESNVAWTNSVGIVMICLSTSLQTVSGSFPFGGFCVAHARSSSQFVFR
jgi:hypothetical protein